MTEESRDTVDESDVWYPQFSAAATLKPVHKLDEEKQTGLRNLLEARMDRRTFEDRFLKPHGDASSSSSSSTSSPGRSVADKEASSESLFNRTAKLGALLANRPDRARLESLNIMKTPQGHASASFALKQKQLETSKRKDRLNSFLSARPSFEDVKRKGIVLERQEASRPQEKLASARSVLGDFMLSRPNMNQLVQQKILTDIGDLPGGLERTQANQTTPAKVPIEHKTFVQVAIGFAHTMVLDSEGVVHVCGSGANGRLGMEEGSFADVKTLTPLPQQHFGGETVKTIDAGENHSAIITTSGQLYTFGSGGWGRLGQNSQDDVTVPRPVALPLGEKASQVSCGAYHTLVLCESGKVFAMGWNKNGRCGVGRKHPSLILLSPVQVAFFDAAHSPVRQLHAGQGTSCAVLNDGSLWTFGAGAFGALGHGDEVDQWEPKRVDLLNERVRHVALGATHSLVLTEKGHLYSFGANDKQQLGRSDEKLEGSGVSSPPVKSSILLPGLVTLLHSASDMVHARGVAAGKSHSLLIDGGGSIFAWGMGSRGVLGLGKESDVATPTKIEGTFDADPAMQAAASWTHSAAITQSGALYTWGAKNNGRLAY